MRATLWSDYLCPWCYLGRDRTRLMEDRGVTVIQLPFDLHPEVPAGGVRVRSDGRLARTLEHVARECSELGLPFTPPTRIPSTRRALEVAEIVRRRWPQRFGALDEALFAAVFVHGVDLGDPRVLDDLVDQTGAPVEEVGRMLAGGLGARAIDESMERAREAGVAATPAWLLESGLLIPGVQPRATLARWLDRMQRGDAT
jgi:predicted DsbA family dithiol-disulfide isomerase